MSSAFKNEDTRDFFKPTLNYMRQFDMFVGLYNATLSACIVMRLNDIFFGVNVLAAKVSSP